MFTVDQTRCSYQLAHLAHRLEQLVYLGAKAVADQHLGLIVLALRMRLQEFAEREARPGRAVSGCAWPTSPAYNSSMMPEAIDRELSREPFIPVRLHLRDGATCDVTNPGLSFIAFGALYIARTDRPHSRILDAFQLISLRHIVRIELLEASAA